MLPCQIWSFCIKWCIHGSARDSLPCGGGVADPLEIRPSLTCCTNLVVLGQTVPALSRSFAWKFDRVISRSSELTGSISDLWLPINVPLQPWESRFRDNRRLHSSIEFFSHPLYRKTLLMGFPLKLGNGACTRKKLEVWGYQTKDSLS